MVVMASWFSLVTPARAELCGFSNDRDARSRLKSLQEKLLQSEKLARSAN